MTSDQQAAAASLLEIERVEQRTFEAVAYSIASSILIMWGVLTAAGYVFCHFYPAHGGYGWLAVNVSGFAGMVAMLSRATMAPRQFAFARRVVVANVVLIAYGAIWVVMLGPFSVRQLDAFWPTLFMLGYVLAGIWMGRFFIVCGAIVTALTVVGYLWAGPSFDLWMAAIEGTVLIGTGLWLRRIGATP